MIEHLNPQPVTPRRVVIIGAGGFVGGAATARLNAESVPVLASTRRELDLLAADAGQLLADRITAEDSVVLVSAIAPCRTSGQFLDNVAMARALCAALEKTVPAHLVYISSDAVYADGASLIDERSCAQPSSLHGAMHAAREAMLRASYSGPLCVLRPSLLYGARDPHNGYGPNRFRRLAAEGKDIVLFGQGEEQRDHVLIDDLARLVGLVLARRSRGVLNVATGVSVSFREIADMVVALAGKSVAIKDSLRQNPISHRHFDITASHKAFPRFHYTSLADGLARVHAEVHGLAQSRGQG